jgi:hypothetical protein
MKVVQNEEKNKWQLPLPDKESCHVIRKRQLDGQQTI